MTSYVIGVDFGTQSARAIVVDCGNGEKVGECNAAYTHGVMEEQLPGGTPLSGSGWALSDPGDYMQALKETVQGAMTDAGLPKQAVRAIAIAATACTIMPVDAQLTPLCHFPAFKNHPQAYCKLWKHHRAQQWADALTEAARRVSWPRLSEYGGRISSEWAVPKVLEAFYEDRQVYAAADRFMQFSDWLTAWLTGDPDAQNGSIAAYKALWDIGSGDPPVELLDAADAKCREIVCQKLRGRKILAGECAGVLRPEAAEMLGLQPGICVGMAHTDAHCAAYGAGIAKGGDYVYIIGTSSCGHLLSPKRKSVPGVTGALSDALIQGYTCYSAGQAAVGDMLDWFIQNALPSGWEGERVGEGGSVHGTLELLAARQRPGACGLVMLDWLNGNRSILSNTALSGMLVGLTGKTSPVDIYRAMLDAIAFGHREILDQFERYGLDVGDVVLCGAVTHKNALLMQIMADVLNRDILISRETQTTARGAAICAAAALGKENGGYDGLSSAIASMRSEIWKTVQPRAENEADYAPLYALYHRLYVTFGQSEPDIMEQLRQMKR